jgi:hypothetical protein
MSDNNIELSKIFEEASHQENALFTALMECGKDFAKSDKKLPHDNSFYDWLEKTPKKAMISELIIKLNELGYEIKKT